VENGEAFSTNCQHIPPALHSSRLKTFSLPAAPGRTAQWMRCVPVFTRLPYRWICSARWITVGLTVSTPVLRVGPAQQPAFSNIHGLNRRPLSQPPHWPL